MNIPARQSERNEAFTRAVWPGDAKTAAALVGGAAAGGCDGGRTRALAQAAVPVSTCGTAGRCGGAT